MAATLPHETAREPCRAAGLLVVVAGVVATLGAAGLAASAVEELAALARAEAIARVSEPVPPAAHRASFPARDLGSQRAVALREVEAARSAALGRCAAACGLGLALVGGAAFGAARLARRGRERACAARARARLARLGLLAGGLERELVQELQGAREAVLALGENLPEDLPHLGDEVSPGDLCEAAQDHLVRAEATLRGFVTGARPEPAPPRVADVAAFVRIWARGLEAELAAHGVGLVLEGASAPACAVIDAAGLKRIFWSLVRNARDAAPAGSLVHVSLAREADRVRIRVADGGPGIELGRREEVWEPLLSTKPWGVGLGLSVSRRLAEAMGARLELVGGPPGAVFEVSLRAAPLTIPLDALPSSPPVGWPEAA